MKQEKIEDELRQTAPRLYEQRKLDDGFRIPDDYFESFEDRFLVRMEAADLNRQHPLKVIKKTARRVTLPRMFMAAAAVCALVLAAVWFFKPVAAIEQPLASVELSEEEIESYLLENVQDFEAEQLAVLPDEDENEYQLPTRQIPSKAIDTLDDVRPEDVEHILNDMTEEELEEIL